MTWWKENYQDYAEFLLLIELSQEAHSYSTQRFEIIRAEAKRQVVLIIFFIQLPQPKEEQHNASI